MKRKSRKLTIWDIPNVKPSPVRTGRVTTLQSFIEDEAMEQARRNQARIVDPQRMQELRMFWMRDFADIENDRDRLPFDDLNLPTTDEQDVQTATRCISAFPAYLEKKGVTLSRDGWRRFAYYAFSHLINHVVINNDTLECMFDRLADLHVFTITNESQGTKVEPAPAAPEPEQPAKATVADIERASDRNALKIAETLWAEDVVHIFRQWLDHMATTYAVYLTPAQHDLCQKWWRRNGEKNPMRGADWEDLRRWLVKIGELDPMKALSADERLAASIDRQDLGQMSFEAKRQLAADLNGLLQARREV